MRGEQRQEVVTSRRWWSSHSVGVTRPTAVTQNSPRSLEPYLAFRPETSTQQRSGQPPCVSHRREATRPHRGALPRLRPGSRMEWLLQDRRLSRDQRPHLPRKGHSVHALPMPRTSAVPSWAMSGPGLGVRLVGRGVQRVDAGASASLSPGSVGCRASWQPRTGRVSPMSGSLRSGGSGGAQYRATRG